MTEHEEHEDREPLFDELPAAERAAIEKGERLRAAYCLNAGPMLALANDEPDWLIEDAVTAGAITYLCSRPGVGKSWLAYDLVLAVAQGRQWLDFPVSAPAKVLVLNLDSPTSECAARFKRLGLRAQDPVYFHSIGAKRAPEGFPAILQLPTAFDAIDAIVGALRPRLILVDSLRQAHTLDESSSRDMSQITAQLRYLASDAAVFVIHHLRKASKQQDSRGRHVEEDPDADDARGSGEIQASADTMIMLKGDVKTEAHATWKKTRQWAMAENRRTFALVEDRIVGAVPLVFTLQQCGPMTRGELAKALHLPQLQAKALIDDAIVRGLVREAARTAESDTRKIELVTTKGAASDEHTS